MPVDLLAKKGNHGVCAILKDSHAFLRSVLEEEIMGKECSLKSP